MEVFRAVLRASRAYDFDMTRELTDLFENAVLWTAAACRVPPKHAKRYRKRDRQVLKVTEDKTGENMLIARGDPNRSSVAETKTRMSKLTSQRVMFLKW